jgi:hypothetical protein
MTGAVAVREVLADFRLVEPEGLLTLFLLLALMPHLLPVVLATETAYRLHSLPW